MRLFTFFSMPVSTSLGQSVWQHARLRIQLICLAITLVIGVADYFAGREVTLAFIYAAPISVAAWFAGRATGLVLAVLSVALWIGGDLAVGLYSGVLVSAINCAYRLAFYCLLALALARLGELQRSAERRAEYRAQALARETAERERLEQDMIEISEREQRRIGQDLHDSLCQHLMGTALAGQALAETLQAAERPEAEKARKLVQLVEESITVARGMAKGLHPVEMEADGLMRALEDFATSTSDIFGIRCHFLCHVPVLISPPAAATHLYRIAQEAVHNAIKHGHASEIRILLDESESGAGLVISDNGEGFSEPLPDNGGMGLRIMADRAKMIGARFAIARNVGRGMELSCWLPTATIQGERLHV